MNDQETSAAVAVLRAMPDAQEFMRRRYGIPDAPVETLARYIVTYNSRVRWWASMGAPHTTPLESHGRGWSERDAIENLLANLWRLPC